MNITILANRDIASNLALNYLLPELSQHNLSVFLSDAVGSKPLSHLSELAFFEQQLFNEILFPSIDKKDSSIKETKIQVNLTFKGLEKYTTGTIDTLNNINEPLGLERLKLTKPDIIVSIRFGKILKPLTIKTAKFGVLNLHSGLLPQYQGVMATYWAMLNKDKMYGTTLHFIENKSIDTGAVISISQHSLNLNNSYLENVLNLYPAGCKDIISAIQKIHIHGQLNSKPQQGNGQYYSFPSKEQLATFYQQNMRLYSQQHIIKVSQSYLNAADNTAD